MTVTLGRMPLDDAIAFASVLQILRASIAAERCLRFDRYVMSVEENMERDEETQTKEHEVRQRRGRHGKRLLWKTDRVITCRAVKGSAGLGLRVSSKKVEGSIVIFRRSSLSSHPKLRPSTS